MSEHQPLIGRNKQQPRNTRLLEPLTDIKRDKDAMRKTDSSFMPSPTKLPSSKLLPLKDRDDIKKEDVCECASPMVARA